MSEQKHHQELINGFYNQLKEIFDSSKQAIYLYLDDNHKVCNQRFVDMQGFSSPDEWAKVDDPLEVTVDKTSQRLVASAYRNATENFTATSIEVKLKKKNGETFNASMIMVPVTYKGHVFALHFITKK